MSKVNVFQPTSYRCGHLLVFALLLSSLTIFILWTKDIPQVLEFVRPSFHDGAQQYQPVQEMPRRFFAVEPGPDEGMTLIEENHLTPNGGFLHVVEPSGRTSFYGISMYHQLHCIDMLRAGLAGGALPSEHEHHHQARDEPRPTDKLTSNHMEHCLDYLAQAVLCAADDTVEAPRVRKLDNGELNGLVNGKVVHQCKNPRYITDAVLLSEKTAIPVRELRDGDTLRSLLLS